MNDEVGTRIDIVSDAICPWCYIGKRQLEHALATLNDEGLQFSVHWNPFQLNPDMPKEGRDRASYRAWKFGSVERMQEADARVAQAVEDIAREHASLLITTSAREDPARERELVTALLRRRVDALLIVPAGPDHRYIARAGFAEVVDVREGAALASLPKIAAEGRPAFDMSFIDADKSNNPEYFAWALKLSKPGSIIVVDNVVRDGAVIDASSQDASVRGVRRLAALIAATPNVSATAIQTVGAKGYDGFILARVAAA